MAPRAAGTGLDQPPPGNQREYRSHHKLHADSAQPRKRGVGPERVGKPPPCGSMVLRLVVAAAAAKPHRAGNTSAITFSTEPSCSTAPVSMTCPIASRMPTSKARSCERAKADTTRPRAIEVTEKMATSSISSASGAAVRNAP